MTEEVLRLLPLAALLLFLLYSVVRMFFWMPGLFRAFPRKDEPGPWMAVALRVTAFGGRTEYATAYCAGGLRRAYCKARLLGLRADWAIPACGGYIGVDWALRRPTREETDAHARKTEAGGCRGRRKGKGNT